uniref:Uncharacterized protein n=1 Tax=Cacopsylla melanoneura TaxID=428564 RepID=A0A8D8U1F0_9HEMI
MSSYFPSFLLLDFIRSRYSLVTLSSASLLRLLLLLLSLGGALISSLPTDGDLDLLVMVLLPLRMLTSRVSIFIAPLPCSLFLESKASFDVFGSSFFLFLLLLRLRFGFVTQSVAFGFF